MPLFGDWCGGWIPPGAGISLWAGVSPDQTTRQHRAAAYTIRHTPSEGTILMRKILLGLVAATAVAAPLALASSANATVAVENGVGHVDKGDVQTALGWNNKAFDGGAGTLKFTAGRRVRHRRLQDVLLQRHDRWH